MVFWISKAQLVIFMGFSLSLQFFLLVFLDVFVDAVKFLLVNEVVDTVGLFASKVGDDLNSASFTVFVANDTLARSAFKASNALLRRNSSIEAKFLYATLFFIVCPLRACLRSLVVRHSANRGFTFVIIDSMHNTSRHV